MIYLDNAATSFPKPKSVIDAVAQCLNDYCANPGRSGHTLAIQAARKVFEAREKVAEFFHVADSRNVIFTANATMAINCVFTSLLEDGDHVVVSSMEHNAVMRPLRYREQQGTITVSCVPCSDNGQVNADIIPFIKKNTKLVVVNHASNVNGAVLDIATIVKKVKKANPKTAILIDASQSAGIIPINVQAIGCDFVAFTGHKALYGPQGIGGLIINTKRPLKPFIMGGTGSKSESQYQPEFLPDMFESGTLNLPGIMGLKAGIEYIHPQIEEIKEKELTYIQRIVECLGSINGIKLYWSNSLNTQIGVISFSHEKISCSQIGQRLNDEFSICVRTGLHCAPLAHQTIGSFPDGTVRVSVGAFTKNGDIDVFCKAIETITKV
ncbi:MAG: aminotransferase class V-fold PLP-dependent enzyme [Spirochaetes bacterium]|nr:aminotransferase class V-fold PLP-dependent enzyme [Spirochaetota bacterium]